MHPSFQVEPPSFLFVHVNKRCNLRCQHCDYWRQNDSDRQEYLSRARKAEILEEFAELSPDGSVVICGGESMLDLEDYFAITRACRKLGLRALSVTNGTVIHSPEMADRVVLEGPHEISVSLDSHVEAVHDRMRGFPGSFTRAVKAVRLLLDARDRLRRPETRIYVMGLVYDENYRELEAFYDFVLGDLGADKLKLNFLQPTFGAHGIVDHFFRRHGRIDPDLLMEIIGRCDRKHGLNLNPVWLAQVGMYFRSINAYPGRILGWRSPAGTREHICNSYRRNIMVDLYGIAKLCFSPRFPGTRLSKRGDLRDFWCSADALRARMSRCNALCGISHSVRRESSTLTPNRPARSYFQNDRSAPV